MSLLSFIDTIINLTIKVLIFWCISNFYILLVFVINCCGIYGVLFDLEFFGSDICWYIHRFILILADIFLCLVLLSLAWIFIFWMIIKIFVPHIILVPIPIIPFIIPIPLKSLMLRFIPPFQTLTDRGILPLCLRLALLFFFSEAFLKDKFGKAISDTYNVFFDDIKGVLGEIFKKPEPEIHDKEKTPNEISTIDDGTNNEKTAKKIIDDDSKGRNKEVMDLINEELEICMKSKQSLSLPNSGILSSVNDFNNYAECYSRSIKAYIDNKL